MGSAGSSRVGRRPELGDLVQSAWRFTPMRWPEITLRDYRVHLLSQEPTYIRGRVECEGDGGGGPRLTRSGPGAGRAARPPPCPADDPGRAARAQREGSGSGLMPRRSRVAKTEARGCPVRAATSASGSLPSRAFSTSVQAFQVGWQAGMWNF